MSKKLINKNDSQNNIQSNAQSNAQSYSQSYTQSDSRLEYVLNRYKTKLENYEYIQYEKLCNIEPKNYISYIKKNNLNIKNGYVKEIKDNSIIELTNHYKKRIWFIYSKDYYIFVRISNVNKFKTALKSLIDSDFSDVREKIKIKKLNTECC